MERHSFHRVLKLCEKYAFPQNFHTRKLGEIAVFFAVHFANLSFSHSFLLKTKVT